MTTLRDGSAGSTQIAASSAASPAQCTGSVSTVAFTLAKDTAPAGAAQHQSATSASATISGARDMRLDTGRPADG